jgi:apolipoprotein N-acyltransferase
MIYDVAMWVLAYLGFGVSLGLLFWIIFKIEYNWKPKDTIDVIAAIGLAWALLPFVAIIWWLYEKIQKHVGKELK